MRAEFFFFSFSFSFFLSFFLSSLRCFGLSTRHCRGCTGFLPSFFPHFVRRFDFLPFQKKQISRLEKNSEVKLFLLESKKNEKKEKFGISIFFCRSISRQGAIGAQVLKVAVTSAPKMPLASPWQRSANFFPPVSRQKTQ